MNTQQIIVFVVVSIAAVYLGRNLVVAAQSFFRGKGGCSSGCGKCGFAPADKTQARQTAPSNIIALRDIHTLPNKRN